MKERVSAFADRYAVISLLYTSDTELRKYKYFSIKLPKAIPINIYAILVNTKRNQKNHKTRLLLRDS